PTADEAGGQHRSQPPARAELIDNEAVAESSTRGWLTRNAVNAAEERPRRERKTRRPSRLALLLVLLALLAGLALWKIPEWQLAAAREQLAAEDQLTPSERLLLDKELFQAETGARSTLALILAAGGLLLGLAIAWRRFEISRELRTHERFANAVEQLASERGDGSPRTETRLGGIYALERLAIASDREYWRGVAGDRDTSGRQLWPGTARHRVRP